MDIELLKTFLEVNRTRHFGKASDNLCVTQAAVSARIRLLEDHLGVALFTRARNNILLTTEGERLIPHAESVLLSWSRAKQEVALKKELKFQLNVGTTIGLWHFMLRDRLSLFRESFADMALKLDIYSPHELTRLIEEGVLDLALTYEPPQLPNLNTKAVDTMKLVMVSSEKSITLKQAVKELIYIDWGTAFSMFYAARFPENNTSPMTTNTANIAEHQIREHGGCAYLPISCLDEGGLFSVEGAPTHTRKIYACYTQDTSAISNFGEVIKFISR